MTAKKLPHPQLSHISISLCIVCLLLMMVLPVNLLCIGSAERISASLLQQASYAVGSVQSVYAQEISQRMERSDAYLIETLNHNPLCESVLRQRGGDAYLLNKYLLAQELIAKSYEQSAADLYFLYSPRLHDVLLTYGVAPTRPDKASTEAWIIANAASSHTAAWSLANISGVSYAVHTFYKNGMYFGSLLELTPYAESVRQSVGYPSALVAFEAETQTADGKRQRNVAQTTESATPIRQDETQTTSMALTKTGGMLTVETPLESSSFRLFVRFDRSDALSSLPFFQRNALLIAVLSLLFIPLLFLALYFLLLQPLAVLLRAQEALRRDPAYRIPERRPWMTREFNEIASAFNRMADHIHRLKIESYEQQMARQQVELDNLQLTIRPHFLQNTFGLLYTLCQMKQNGPLGRFILFLSDYFRYIYQGLHQLTPFSSELAIIRGYLELAAFQHPHDFEAAYELPEKTDDVPVPPLLIHNFVENVISHGLRHGSLVHLSLRLTKEEGRALFEIRDDGIGIPAETVARLNRGEPIEDHERVHVGLRNSFRRLEKIYRGAAGMRIESEAGKGTAVFVWVPLPQSQ